MSIAPANISAMPDDDGPAQFGQIVGDVTGDDTIKNVERLLRSMHGAPIPRSSAPAAPPSYASARDALRESLRAAARTVPLKYRPMRFGGAVERYVIGAKDPRVDAIALTRRWAEQPKELFVLAGGSAAGKSILSAAVLHAQIDAALALTDALPLGKRDRRLVRRGTHCLYMTSVQVTGDDCPVLKRARQASVLAIDDLGGDLTANRPWSRSLVRELILDRHAWGRPTFITTWMDINDLESDAAYGGGVGRRLREAMAAGQFCLLRKPPPRALRQPPGKPPL